MNRARTGVAAAVVACAACCALPFAVPAALLSAVSTGASMLSMTHNWWLLAAGAALLAAWTFVRWQSARTQRHAARSTVVVLQAATVVVAIVSLVALAR